MSRALLLLALVACHPQKTPELRVIGHRHEVVYVQVTNPASHVMRLDKLDYKFEAAHSMVAHGQLPLERDVPAGAAVVVEVPLETDAPPNTEIHMTGELTAELDDLVRTFAVSAQIQPH